MAWNLWTALFGTKRGKAFEPTGTAILTAVSPQAAQAVDTINTVAANVPEGSTTVGTVISVAEQIDPVLIAKLETAEKATLTAVNKKLESAGVAPLLETELDDLITAEYKALEAGHP